MWGLFGFDGAADAASLGGGEFGVFLLESFDAACGVDEFLFAGVEGVAASADFDFDVLERRAGFEGVSAGAADFCEVVLGMDFFFHGDLYDSKGKCDNSRGDGAFVPCAPESQPATQWRTTNQVIYQIRGIASIRFST